MNESAILIRLWSGVLAMLVKVNYSIIRHFYHLNRMYKIAILIHHAVLYNTNGQ